MTKIRKVTPKFRATHSSLSDQAIEGWNSLPHDEQVKHYADALVVVNARSAERMRRKTGKEQDPATFKFKGEGTALAYAIDFAFPVEPEFEVKPVDEPQPEPEPVAEPVAAKPETDKADPNAPKFNLLRTGRKISFSKRLEVGDGRREVNVSIDGEVIGHWFHIAGSGKWMSGADLDEAFGKDVLSGFRLIIDARRKARRLFRAAGLQKEVAERAARS